MSSAIEPDAADHRNPKTSVQISAQQVHVSPPMWWIQLMLLNIHFWTCGILYAMSWAALPDICIVLNTSRIAIAQYVGAPLYLINRPYYYRYMAFTKKAMTLLILSFGQIWTNTLIHISGDDSVKGQISLIGGRIQHRFPERTIIMANHHVSP